MGKTSVSKRRRPSGITLSKLIWLLVALVIFFYAATHQTAPLAFVYGPLSLALSFFMLFLIVMRV